MADDSQMCDKLMEEDMNNLKVIEHKNQRVLLLKKLILLANEERNHGKRTSIHNKALTV